MSLFKSLDREEDSLFVTPEALERLGQIERGYSKRLKQLGLNRHMGNWGTVSITGGMTAYSGWDMKPSNMCGTLLFGLALGEPVPRECPYGTYYEVPTRTLLFRVSFLPGEGLQFDRARAPMTATEAEDFGQWVADLIVSSPLAQSNAPDPADQAQEL
ncbi:hypothetical protein HY630_01050 [Candidatus Uhrbacteria bacterium]|nr:hypothetical protein [Candidatus Uhrbacteria bacterium]